jgi:hypothetical protein
MCVCEYINFIYKILHENNINVRKKVILKQLMRKKVGLISLNLRPNVPLIYLKHILDKNLDWGTGT